MAKKIGSLAVTRDIIVRKTDEALDNTRYDRARIKDVFERCNPVNPHCVLNLADIEHNRIPPMRSDYLIPEPPDPNHRKGGWVRESPWNRRLDFYIGYEDKGMSDGERPLVYRMLSADFPSNADKAVDQIMRMKDTDWGIDPGLSIAICVREARHNLFHNIESSYVYGGLDNFFGDYHTLKRRKMLPSSFTDHRKAPAAIYDSHGNFVRWDPTQDQKNEAKKYCKPAKLSHNNQIEAYSATINNAFFRFVFYTLDTFGVMTDILYEINHLTLKQRRIWTGAFFMGVGTGRLLVEYFYENGWKLRKIEEAMAELPGKDNHDNNRRGVVTAADAELIDGLLGPDLPPPTGVEVDYNWSSIA